MSFLNNTPKGILIIDNMPYMAKIINLPDHINCTECPIDMSDTYLIYRTIANRIISEISEIENKRYAISDEKFSQYANNVFKKGSFMGLLYLFTHKNDLYKQNEDELKLDTNLHYLIGQSFYTAVYDNELNNSLGNPELYRILEKYLKDKGCFHTLISGIRIYNLIKNLEKHNLDSDNLRACELTILSCLEPDAQIFYYNSFLKYKDNPEIAWNHIRTHIYEREIIKNDAVKYNKIDESISNELISDDLVLRIRQETRKLFSSDTIHNTLKFIQTDYLKENFDISHISKICFGIKELLYHPVIDYIGTDNNGITKIFSFRIDNSDVFSIALQSVIEINKKNIITLYSEKGKKKKYILPTKLSY